jgi:hypothetical protein
LIFVKARMPNSGLLLLKERIIMNAPFASIKFALSGRSVALVVAVAILVPISPHEASAKGGTFHLFSAWSSPAEAATVTLSRPEKTTVIFDGCGGKRQRNPNTHRCRGPADFGN